MQSVPEKLPSLDFTNKDYIKFLFTFPGNENENNPCPKCLVSGDTLSNKSIVLNKLRRYFTSKHSHCQKKQ